MKTLLIICRYIVGLLFIFSGLIKANDPLGLSYKMQEFFEVWHWTGLEQYTLALSILMIAFEIIAGVAVILGWQMRLFSWLLLGLILFFTFLTGYALFSGKIKTCGCFGDCIPLTADQSFMKDLFLLALILFLFLNRNRIQPGFSTRASLILLSVTTVFSFALQGHVLYHLPLVDCLPYKEGKRIQDQMRIPAGSIPDSSVISFVYQKAGKEVEFTADKFPEDFSDEQYTFIRRYDKLIRKGNAEPAIKDFVLLSATGTDTTRELLSQPGEAYWLFIKELEKNDVDAVTRALSQFRPMYIVSPVAGSVEEQLGEKLNGVPVLRCDVVAVKTAARNNLTLYKINQGVILDKWALKDKLR
ncbi:BT_3928 family protein [Flavihumibacter petaseus]|uniref:Methylamine utilisation protein MauE domain-containing protein n=1 Tax=Flavihumibacter petaseus NBRC 106054 TaxID=1220578 RepID=A0A0E9N739_9BACT|nr:BT_3928 family protein [Flavihumibacter petaseus]GAO45644.1 hypothetical protein FPE01S_07_00320 [Flavihumibacter petaseus NBRC 106054]